ARVQQGLHHTPTGRVPETGPSTATGGRMRDPLRPPRCAWPRAAAPRRPTWDGGGSKKGVELAHPMRRKYLLVRSLVGGVDMHARSSATAAVLGSPQVLVAANHLVYYCERDPKAHGWRCGRCEVGVFLLAPGDALPRPGRTCGVCQAQICLLNNGAD